MDLSILSRNMHLLSRRDFSHYTYLACLTTILFSFAILLVVLRLTLAWRKTYVRMARKVAFLTAIALSLPRTFRVFSWALRAGLAYKRLARKERARLRRLNQQNRGKAPSQDDSASDGSSELEEGEEGVALPNDSYQERLAAIHKILASKLVAVCRLNGGIYIKTGQFASAFGVLPIEYREPMSQLEDRATPMPFEKIRTVLDQELGSECIPGLFLDFSETATAAASLAQVHKAKLATGEEVAVKLQYPGLKQRIDVDLMTIRFLSNTAARFFPDWTIGWIVDELEAKLEIEVDFRVEIKNSKALQSLLGESHPTTTVPKIYENLSTKRVLVMEWIEGIKLTDVTSLRKESINPKAVGFALIRVFAEMALLNGYVHGDPHAGNIMVRPKKGGGRNIFRWLFRGSLRQFELVFLDHGTYLSITPAMREQYCELLCSFFNMDNRVSKEVSISIAGPIAGVGLPLLLQYKTTSRREQRKLRRSIGVKNVGDINKMLSSAPRDLVELIRVTTMIRKSSLVLGVSNEERQRVLGSYAFKGLPWIDSKDPHIHPSSSKALYRARLHLVLTALNGVHGIACGMKRTWSSIVMLFSGVLFD
jgi:aarF domain-containing kinase